MSAGGVAGREPGDARRVVCECGGDRFQEHGTVAYKQTVELAREGDSVVRTDGGTYESEVLWEGGDGYGIECATCLKPIAVKDEPSPPRDAASSLAVIHRYLFPERYADVELYQWHADTIEDVAAMLEAAMRQHGVPVPAPDREPETRAEKFHRLRREGVGYDAVRRHIHQEGGDA